MGTLSGLPGHIYLTAMFSLGFSALYREKGRGWQGSKRTDPTWRVRVIENRDTKSHGHIQDAQITIVVMPASHRFRCGSSLVEILPELLIFQARIRVLSSSTKAPSYLEGFHCLLSPPNCYKTAKL